MEELEATLSRAFELSLIEVSPDLSRYVDLTIFWRIMDNNLLSATSNEARSIFGISLKQPLRTQEEAEIISTHLLPEPTRVNSLPHSSLSATSTPNPRTDPENATRTSNVINTNFLDSFVDTPFPAQSFFALGQDFVGNADDWMNWTGM